MKRKTAVFMPFFLFLIAHHSSSQVEVREADTVALDTLQSSAEVTNLSVSPRIVVEYSNSTYNAYLSNIPTPLPDLTRIVVQYSNSSYSTHLSNIPSDLSDLTRQLPPNRRIVINYAESTYRPDLNKEQGIPVAVEDNAQSDNLPQEFTLFQNYPNPFNPTTKIRYQLRQSTEVSLKIYNLLGQLIRTLIDEKQRAGEYSVVWDGKDAKGERVASGIYLYKIQTQYFVKTKKMILIR